LKIRRNDILARLGRHGALSCDSRTFGAHKSFVFNTSIPKSAGVVGSSPGRQACLRDETEKCRIAPQVMRKYSQHTDRSPASSPDVRGRGEIRVSPEPQAACYHSG